VVTRHLTFFIQHYDLPSLLAGKLHATITRKYAKGRDWYDLLWYLSQRPPVEPNLPLLHHALDQTKGVGQCEARAWRALVSDARPFLERPQEADLLTRDNLLELLSD
jgi:hypothetical protein